MHTDPKMMEKISAFIDDYYAEKKTSPSIGKIATFFGCARTTIYRYLIEMSQRGMIFYDGESIQIPIVANSLATSVTVVGAIRCGDPNVEFESIGGYMNLPEMIFGCGDFYILRARGDSMIDVGIDKNDLVVVIKLHTACVGDIVVALNANQLITLKTYGGIDKASGQAILKYANQKHIPAWRFVYGNLCYRVVDGKIIKSI